MPTSNSSSGKGRKISLPLYLPSNSRSWRDEESSIVGQNTTVEMASILAVDDSASMRQMVTFTLKGAGYEVVEAQDGHEALGIAKTKTVNLVLTDINMPKMDGIALIRALRALPNYKFTPMLMLTTESAPEKKQEGKAAGATGWMVKPFNPEQLLPPPKKAFVPATSPLLACQSARCA